MSAISIEQVSKNYGRIVALRDISIEVDRGTIYGFLGRNGAGKSTTIGIILQFLKQDSGRIRVFDEEVRWNARPDPRIAIIPDADLPKISGIRMLRHTARYYGFQGQALRRQISEVVDLLEIRDIVTRSTRNLSKGQKTKIKIANALVSNPEMIIADEPTSGLDPIARRQFLELIIDQVKQQGKTVFFSSHVIGEVEKVCDKLAIINEGEVVTQGTLSEIYRKVPVSNSYSIRGAGISTELLEQLEDIVQVNIETPGQFTVHSSYKGEQTPPFLRALVNDPSVVIHSISRENMDLEEIFMQSVNNSREVA